MLGRYVEDIYNLPLCNCNNNNSFTVNKSETFYNYLKTSCMETIVIYLCVCVYVHVCAFMCVYAHVCLSMYTCMYKLTLIHIYQHLTYIYIFTYLHYVCIQSKCIHYAYHIGD